MFGGWKIKIVFDTSFLLAAFYPGFDRPCFSRDVYDFAILHGECFISNYIKDEFVEKCRDKLAINEHRMENLLNLILGRVVVFPDPDPITGPKKLRDRDPADLPIIALAAAVKADYLLSWDKDLLTLGRFRRTRILSPRSFWDDIR